MTTTVEIVPATPADRPFIEGLFQFYIYDFSEFQPADAPAFELNAQGRFDALLDFYWRQADLVPLLIRVESRTVGFALLNATSHSGEPVDRNMAEFFVLRKHRRGGVGAMAVETILRRYPGRWEIAIATRNAIARAFWPRVVGGLGCVRDLTAIELDDDRWRGPILQFVVMGKE